MSANRCSSNGNGYIMTKTAKLNYERECHKFIVMGGDERLFWAMKMAEIVKMLRNIEISQLNDALLYLLHFEGMFHDALASEGIETLMVLPGQ